MPNLDIEKFFEEAKELATSPLPEERDKLDTYIEAICSEFLLANDEDRLEAIYGINSLTEEHPQTTEHFIDFLKECGSDYAKPDSCAQALWLLGTYVNEGYEPKEPIIDLFDDVMCQDDEDIRNEVLENLADDIYEIDPEDDVDAACYNGVADQALQSEHNVTRSKGFYLANAMVRKGGSQPERFLPFVSAVLASDDQKSFEIASSNILNLTAAIATHSENDKQDGFDLFKETLAWVSKYDIDVQEHAQELLLGLVVEGSDNGIALQAAVLSKEASSVFDFDNDDDCEALSVLDKSDQVVRAYTDKYTDLQPNTPEYVVTNIAPKRLEQS